MNEFTVKQSKSNTSNKNNMVDSLVDYALLAFAKEMTPNDRTARCCVETPLFVQLWYHTSTRGFSRLLPSCQRAGPAKKIYRVKAPRIRGGHSFFSRLRNLACVTEGTPNASCS